MACNFSTLIITTRAKTGLFATLFLKRLFVLFFLELLSLALDSGDKLRPNKNTF